MRLQQAHTQEAHTQEAHTQTQRQEMQRKTTLGQRQESTGAVRAINHPNGGNCAYHGSIARQRKLPSHRLLKSVLCTLGLSRSSFHLTPPRSPERSSWATAAAQSAPSGGRGWVAALAKTWMCSEAPPLA